MKREIKFRGMSINGDWHYGLLTILKEKNGLTKEGCYISNSVGMPFAYQVFPETVGQFTGLKDKNEQEVYEGDFLKNGAWVGWVVYDSPEYKLNDGKSLFSISFKDFEVVGNVFEKLSGNIYEE